ncbi:uncharacterized protein LOC122392412 [Amphibalanus amphitrite]|uniref:uncharacterized protein LOC122392412 n=1 Tax=Amphibalanus amphitrite TaxID=1232801 RepID=UPI001C9293C5|nr:uncharacterized protein LOC122392412 [Amphibalanus amphitrite]
MELPLSPLTDNQRLWRLPEEASRPAAAPQGLLRPWWVGRPATLGRGEQAWGSQDSTGGSDAISARSTRNQQHYAKRGMNVRMCGAQLTDFIESLCHDRRRRSGSAVTVRQISSAMSRESIVEACCHRPCSIRELYEFVQPTCGVMHNSSPQIAYTRVSAPAGGQPTSPVTESHRVVTTAGTPPVHLPVFEDPGLPIDGFQKRDNDPASMAWETDSDLASFLVV